jgi:DNA-binding GntR family transcriptional regulator
LRVEASPLRAIRPLGPNRTVEQALVSELRNLVVEGALPPGLRVTYRDLAEQFGVSVTPVRAAVRDLTKEGLLESDAGRGARVTPLSIEDLEEIYAARLGLESLIARLGAERVDDTALANMRARMRDFELAALELDQARYLQEIWEYRAICYRAAQRPRLFEHVSLLFSRSMRYNWLTLGRDPRRIAESLDFQRRFYRACEERDGLAAQRVMREGMDWSADYLIEHVMPTLQHDAETLGEAKRSSG